MAGGRAGQLHRRIGGQASVKGRADDRAPALSLLTDFDHGAAMRGDFRERDLARDAGGIIFAHAGEHQVRRGVFVVHTEEAARGAVRIRIKRDEADEVVVVAELPALGFGGLVQRIEGRAVFPEGIAPAQEERGVVAFGDVMELVHAARDLREAEGRRGARHFLRGGCGSLFRADGAGGKREAGDRRETAEEAAAREAAFDDVADSGRAFAHARVQRNIL